MSTKIVYTAHAVSRIIQRQLPLNAVFQIAEIGVTVQTNGRRVVKRGEVNGTPVHVVLEHNTIITVYVADEFESEVKVQRKRVAAIGSGV
jgi:hypothetical protein